MKGNGIGESCSEPGKDEKCIHSLVQNLKGGETQIKVGMGMCTRFVRLKTGSSDGLLWMRWWTFAIFWNKGNSLTVYPVGTELSADHVLISHFIRIQFNIILSPAPRSLTLFRTFRLRFCMHLSYPWCVLHAMPILSFQWLERNNNNAGWEKKNGEALVEHTVVFSFKLHFEIHQSDLNCLLRFAAEFPLNKYSIMVTVYLSSICPWWEGETILRFQNINLSLFFS
jgi:hypothetical protein